MLVLSANPGADFQLWKRHCECLTGTEEVRHTHCLKEAFIRLQIQPERKLLRNKKGDIYVLLLHFVCPLILFFYYQQLPMKSPMVLIRTFSCETKCSRIKLTIHQVLVQTFRCENSLTLTYTCRTNEPTSCSKGLFEHKT